MTATRSRLPRPVAIGAAILGALSAVLAVLAAVNPQWIESALGFSPDGGSGGTEWGLVAGFALAAVALESLATVHLLRSRHADGV